MTMLYEDAQVQLDETGLTIKRYYFPFGQSKRVAYSEIKGVKKRPLTPLNGQWRAWGMDFNPSWYPLDLGRFGKHTAIELDLGAAIRPTLTPSDPERVFSILLQQGLFQQ